MNSGKGVIANTLKDKYGFSVMGIADPMKVIINKVFGVSRRELWGNSKHRNPKVRQMLQTLGSEWGRKFDQEIWIKHLLMRIEAWTTKGIDPWAVLDSESRKIIPCVGIVIPDIRLSSEIHTLKKRLQLNLIRVKRPIPRDKAEDGHETEIEIENVPMDCFNYIIENDHTLAEYKKKIQIVIKDILHATDTE
jgi:hypothetical protein